MGKKNHTQDKYRSVGEHFVHRLATSAYRPGWGWGILSLAWSAGPVTFVALYTGSYLGLGKLPSSQTFIYFAIYTLVAGLVAFAVNLVRSRVIEPRIEKAHERHSELIDKLFNLTFTVRDFYVRAYDADEQRKIAAWWPLSSASADVDALQEAVRDLTGDDALARGIKRIELYRRQGFHSLMLEESSQHTQKIVQLLPDLRHSYPILSRYLQERFQGISPSLRRGQLRNSGFLARSLEAANNDRADLLSMEDMLDLFNLTLEMLLGRSILILHPVFKNAPKLEESKEKLDAILSDFQLMRRKRNSHLRLLVKHLQQIAKGEPLPHTGMRGFELLERAQTLLASTRLSHRQQESVRRRYLHALQANQRLKRLLQNLKSAEKAYNQQWDKTQFTDHMLIQDGSAPGASGISLQLEETLIRLSDKQKLKSAEALLEQYYEIFSLTESDEISLEDCKQFAVECINLLDDQLDISEPEEQMAIEESRQADFGCIEPGLAAKSKLSWGRLMIEEIQETRSETVHRITRELVHFYNIPLNESSIEYLIQQYGADEDYLQKLAEQESTAHSLESIKLAEAIRNMPSWQKLLKEHKGTS